MHIIKEKEKKGLSPFDNLLSFFHERETILNKQFDDLKEKDIRLSIKEKIIQKILDKKSKKSFKKLFTSIKRYDNIILSIKILTRKQLHWKG